MSDAPLVSVLVVNYNGRHHLAACLDSLRRQTWPARRLEVILVDNASADGSADFVREAYPWVRLVRSPRNLGFAGGNVEALRHARGERIALLNNDADADPNWLEALNAALDATPDVGGATGKVVFRGEPGRVNSAGLLLLRDGRGADRGFREPDRGQYEEPAEVFGASGCAVLYRREMLDAVGFFDRKLFMYYEDVDLCWRARLAGWRFVYTPGAVVRHVHCGTSGEWSPFFCYHVERNRVLVSLKCAPAWAALASVFGLAARAGRAWLRAVRRTPGVPSSPAHALAVTRAAASVLRHLPRVLLGRYRVRVVGRRVSDAALGRFLTVPGGRGA